MSKEKIFAIAILLSAGVLVLVFGAPSSSDIFSRRITYVNQSGQTIQALRFQAGREFFDFVDIAAGRSSTIPLGRWSAYEVTVSGSLKDGGSIGPTQFMLPSNTISRNATVRIRPDGDVTLETD